MVKKYIVHLLQEELIEVEVEAKNEEAATQLALKGAYDNWEVISTNHRTAVSVEEVVE